MANNRKPIFININNFGTNTRNPARTRTFSKLCAPQTRTDLEGSTDMLVTKDVEQEDERSFEGNIDAKVAKRKVLPIKDEDAVQR